MKTTIDDRTVRRANFTGDHAGRRPRYDHRRGQTWQQIADWLIANGWTAPHSDAAAGPSAAELAQRPDLRRLPLQPDR